MDGGTWPPIAGGVPGSAAPPGMAQAGDMAGGGAPGGVDPMALLALAKLARGSKVRNQQRNKNKSKAKARRKG